MTASQDPDPSTSDGQTMPPRWWRGGAAAREDVRTAVALHERFAREIAVTLGRFARTEVQVDVATSEWMTFGEYLAGIPEAITISQVELPGADDGMLLGIETGVGMQIIDRLLGGGGGPAPQRGPTALELDLLRDVLTAMLPAVAGTFGSTLTGPPTLGRLTTQPQLLRPVPDTASTMVLNYRVALDTATPASGLLSLCYPTEAVGLLLAEAGRWAAAQPEAPPDPMLRYLIGEVQLDVVATLQPSSVPAEDLRRLRVGDVLVLDHRRTDPIDLSVGATVVLDGELGRRGKKVAVRTTRWRVVAPGAVITEVVQ